MWLEHYNGAVAFLHRMVFKHIVAGGIDRPCLGKQNDTARLTVKAMHDARIRRIFHCGMLAFLFFKKIAHYGSVQIVAAPRHAGFHGEKRGLVHHKNYVVLVEHIAGGYVKRNVIGLFFIKHFFFIDEHCNALARPQLCGRIAALHAVHTHHARHNQPSHFAVGNVTGKDGGQFGTQIFVERNVFLRFEK